MKLKIKEIVVFSMLGALMFAIKLVMEPLPNIHLVGVVITAITLVYRVKALYPIYIFVVLFGLYYGFSVWWIPYIYVWTVLWGMVMVLPKRIPKKVQPFVYAGICGLHGFLYGTLYAPFQAIAFGYTFKQTLTWISFGIPFDITHGVSNIICGLIMILPIVKALKVADKQN